MYYPEKNIKYDLNPEIWGIEENMFRSSDNLDEDFSIGKYASIGRNDNLGNAPLMGAYPLENAQINVGSTSHGHAAQGAAQGTQVPVTGTTSFAPFIVDTEQQTTGTEHTNQPYPLTSMGSEALGFEPMMPMYPPMPNMWPQAQWSNQGMGFPPYNPYIQQGIGPMQPGIGPMQQGFGPMQPGMSPMQQGFGPMQPGMSPMQQGFGPMQPEQWSTQQMGAYPPYIMSNLGQTNLPMMPAMPIIPGAEAPMGFQMNEPYPFGYPLGLWCYPMPNPYMMNQGMFPGSPFMMNQGMFPGSPFMMNQGMFPGSPFMGPMESSEEMMQTDQEPSNLEGTDDQGFMRHKKHKKKKKKVNKYNYYNCGAYMMPYSQKSQGQHDNCGCYHPMPYMWLSSFMHDMKDDGCCHHHQHPHHQHHR